MEINVSLSEESMDRINELAGALKISRSKLIRRAIKDFYLKEKRARENLLFFVDLYRNGVIGKEMLFVLLPRDDAEAVVIGSKFGKEAAEVVRGLDS